MTGALERLYVVFGRLPRPPLIEGCEECVERLHPHLIDRPVRSLDPGELRRYASDVLLTVGSPDDFRYFLPRLLECAAADAFSYPDPEIVFGKLAIAGWRTWPSVERAPVEDFLAAWWAEVLAGDQPRLGIGVVVCSLGATGIDMAPFLDRWGRLETVAAIRRLHEFVMRDVLWRPVPLLRDPFWTLGSAHQQVVSWLTGGAAERAVSAAFDREIREDVLKLLAEIYPGVTAAAGLAM